VGRVRGRGRENKTLEALANGGTGDINKITLLENLIKHKPLVGLKAIHGHQAKLLKMAHRNGIHLLQMTQLRLCELAVPDSPVAELDGVVAVGGLGLDLGHDVSFFKSHHGDRDDLAVGLEVAHHAQLGPHHSHPCLVPHSDHHALPFPAARFQMVRTVQLEQKWITAIVDERAFERKGMIVSIMANWNRCSPNRY
jgi:hypothetical protein